LQATKLTVSFNDEIEDVWLSTINDLNIARDESEEDENSEEHQILHTNNTESSFTDEFSPQFRLHLEAGMSYNI
jgi:hypothetical protein